MRLPVASNITVIAAALENGGEARQRGGRLRGVRYIIE